MTIFLGLRLTKRAELDGQVVYSDDLLMRLASLPWFQTGRLPTWMRRLLFNSISPLEQQQAQDVIALMLSDALRTDSGSYIEHFDAAKIVGGGPPRPTKITLSIWREQAQGAAAPRDSVMLQFFNSRRANRSAAPCHGKSLRRNIGNRPSAAVG